MSYTIIEIYNKIFKRILIDYYKFITIVFLIFLFFLCFRINSQCIELKDSLSLVILVDNSGSMKHTDPTNKRISATKAFLNFLSEKDQVGIIDFSDKINVLQDITFLNTTNKKQTLINKLEQVPLGETTRIDLAILTALKLFKSNDSSKKVIILISDGAIDINGSPTSKQSLYTTNTFLNETLKKIKTSNIKIYTISIKDPSRNQQIQRLQEKTMSTLANETNGLYQSISSDTDIHNAFIEIIKNIFDPTYIDYQRTSNGIEFYISPLVKRINIIVKKQTSESDNLTIVSPKNIISKSDSTAIITSSPKLDIITIPSKPDAGIWKITYTKNTNKMIFTILADADIKLNINNIDNHKMVSDKINISGQFLKRLSSQDSFKPFLNDKNSLFSEIITPANKNIELEMNKAKKNSYYTYFTPVKDGKYRVSLISKGEINLRSKELSFIVDPIPPKKSVIRLDQDIYIVGETVNLFTKNIKENNISVKIKDPMGNNISSSLQSKKINGNTYFKYPIKHKNKNGEYIFTVDYTDESGKQVNKEIISNVLGTITIQKTPSLFNKIDFNNTLSGNIKIYSNVNLQNMPLKLFLNKLELPNSNLRKEKFTFNSMIDTAMNGKSLELPLSITVQNPQLKPFKPTIFEGKLLLSLCTKDYEILNESYLPIKIYIPSLLERYSYYILLLLGSIIIGIILILIGKQKLFGFNTTI